jgi:hypothetical protein
VYLLPVPSAFALQATSGHIWLSLDASGSTVDIAMYRIEAGTTPGYFQLSEVLLATCLLQGSTRLDQQAEQLLLSLFDVHLRRLSVSSTIPAGVFQPGEGTLDTLDYIEAKP